MNSPCLVRAATFFAAFVVTGDAQLVSIGGIQYDPVEFLHGYSNSVSGFVIDGDEIEPSFDLPSLPFPVAYFGAVAFRSEIYVVGGLVGGEDWLPRAAPLPFLGPTASCWRYSCASWTEVAPLLTPRVGLGLVALPDGRLLAAGGTDGSAALDTAEVFEMGNGSWSNVASMQTARSNFGLGVLNNAVYAVGGASFVNMSSALLPTSFFCTPLASVEVFNISTNTWSFVANLTVPRCALQVAVFQGRLLAIGGFGGLAAQPLLSVESYDPVSNTWQLESLHTAFYHADYSLAVVDVDGASAVWVLNGFDGLFQAEVFSSSLPKWVVGSPFLLGLNGSRGGAAVWMPLNCSALGLSCGTCSGATGPVECGGCSDPTAPLCSNGHCSAVASTDIQSTVSVPSTGAQLAGSITVTASGVDGGPGTLLTSGVQVIATSDLHTTGGPQSSATILTSDSHTTGGPQSSAAILTSDLQTTDSQTTAWPQSSAAYTPANLAGGGATSLAFGPSLWSPSSIANDQYGTDSNSDGITAQLSSSNVALVSILCAFALVAAGVAVAALAYVRRRRHSAALHQGGSGSEAPPTVDGGGFPASGASALLLSYDQSAISKMFADQADESQSSRLLACAPDRCTSSVAPTPGAVSIPEMASRQAYQRSPCSCDAHQAMAVDSAMSDMAPAASEPTLQDARAILIAPRWEISHDELAMQQLLGEGAFGLVHLAVWRGSPVVVKTVRPLSLRELTPEQQEEKAIADALLLKEINAMQALRPHDNIISLRGVCADPAAIVMEYVDGGSLLALLESSQAISGEMALDFCYDIASGMRHLHSEHLLHCDLSARNVLLLRKDNGGFQCKIADFGLAHWASPDTGTYTSRSVRRVPVRWTAPEALSDSQLHTQAMDVWSFGIVIWEILSRQTPYRELKDNMEIVCAIAVGYRLPTPQAYAHPAVLDDVMELCLSKDPTNRPSFATAQATLKPSGPPPPSQPPSDAPDSSHTSVLTYIPLTYALSAHIRQQQAVVPSAAVGNFGRMPDSHIEEAAAPPQNADAETGSAPLDKQNPTFLKSISVMLKMADVASSPQDVSQDVSEDDHHKLAMKGAFRLLSGHHLTGTATFAPTAAVTPNQTTLSGSVRKSSSGRHPSIGKGTTGSASAAISEMAANKNSIDPGDDADGSHAADSSPTSTYPSVSSSPGSASCCDDDCSPTSTYPSVSASPLCSGTPSDSPVFFRSSQKLTVASVTKLLGGMAGSVGALHQRSVGDDFNPFLKDVSEEDCLPTLQHTVIDSAAAFPAPCAAVQPFLKVVSEQEEEEEEEEDDDDDGDFFLKRPASAVRFGGVVGSIGRTNDATCEQLGLGSVPAIKFNPLKVVDEWDVASAPVAAGYRTSSRPTCSAAFLSVVDSDDESAPLSRRRAEIT